MDRRHFIAAGLAVPLLGAHRACAETAVYIGDMHFHSFFGQSTHHARPLAKTLADGKATLVAWKIVGDLPWMDPRTYKQKGEPKPGEALAWFERELARVKDHCAEEGLRIVRVPEHVDRAVQGVPHIVLGVEGATFVESDVAAVRRAYDRGIRHLQLVHYIRNSLGDFQTEPPRHGGMSELGRRVVDECNRLGILIDVAHCTPAVVRDVLARSKLPVVWSHGSVIRGPEPHPGLVTWKARQITLELAKAIAQKGGVIGIWALNLDVGRTVEGYADRLMELAGWIGEDHVAFGTDINGLGTYATLSTYAELRRAVEHWQRAGVAAARVRKLSMGNYARVLRQAMQARQA